MLRIEEQVAASAPGWMVLTMKETGSRTKDMAKESSEDSMATITKVAGRMMRRTAKEKK